MSDHFFEALDEKSDIEELESYRKKYFNFQIDREDIRTNITPIYRNNLYKFYEKHQEFYWKHEEIKFDRDIYHYNALDNDSKSLIDGVIAFFSVGDKLINDNIESNLLDYIPYQEAKMFYRFKAMMEDIHATVYSRTAEHLYPDSKKRKQILDAVRNFEPVKDKVSFIRQYFNSSVDYPTLQIAEVCVELILFAGSFAIIYYFKSLGKFPAICRANELISRDEFLHGSSGAELYRSIKPELKLSDDEVFKIVNDAVNNEKRFLSALLPNPILGLNKDMLCEYIEYIGNITLDLLGASKRYNTPSKPAMLNYVESINYAVKNDFFNATSTQYTVSKFDINPRVNYSETF